MLNRSVERDFTKQIFRNFLLDPARGRASLLKVCSALETRTVHLKPRALLLALFHQTKVSSEVVGCVERYNLVTVLVVLFQFFRPQIRKRGTRLISRKSVLKSSLLASLIHLKAKTDLPQICTAGCVVNYLRGNKASESNEPAAPHTSIVLKTHIGLA